MSEVIRFVLIDWSLMLTETGIRRLDWELVPTFGIIEGPKSGEQRVFLANRDHKECEKLMERLGGPQKVHIQSARARLLDTLPDDYDQIRKSFADASVSEQKHEERFRCGEAQFADFRSDSPSAHLRS